MYKKPLSLIVYANLQRCDDKIWEFIHRQRRHGQVEICHTIGKLYQRIRRSGIGHMVAVLIIADRGELEAILRYADLLTDQKVILVLPDKDQQTISMGHALYPRFIAYSDGELQDVGSVLHKMISPENSYTLEHQ